MLQDASVASQTTELLRWVSSGVRAYDETIAAWKTNCPRLAVWDDAVTDGLVRVVSVPGNGRIVTLTPAGHASLREQSRSAF